MNKLFDTVLELSWQAGLIALAVMAVRLALRRRVSRQAVCWLWALVALRLLLPASLLPESPVSLQQTESPPVQAYHDLRQQQEAYYAVPPAQRPALPQSAAAQHFALLEQLPAIWLGGVGCMLLYMAVSLLHLRWQLRRAHRLEGGVYRCTRWSTPFVLGLIAPRIYVPETVSEQDLPQVLAHERCHIRRWDHVVKPLAFLLLAVNWFNPALWAAYILLGRDMESACDEMVLKNAAPSQRAAYSRALLACAAQPKMAAVCPLAFGEVAVKERVKNVLQNRKPALWAVILLALAAAAIAVCLLTKPAAQTADTLDAETLYALRTPYVGDNAAVSGILDALGFRSAGEGGEGEAYTYSFAVETSSAPYGVVVRYAFAGALPQRTEEWNRQMARRGYLALALIDNAEWLRWEYVAEEGDAPVSGTVYAGDYVLADYNAVQGSAAGLQALMDVLQARLEDGSIVYYPGDALPDFSEITPWPSQLENDPVSIDPADYGIVYDEAHLPDWETCPLSYLCAYLLGADGAYTEGAMDTLAARYIQAPHTVQAYLDKLSAKYDGVEQKLLAGMQLFIRQDGADAEAHDAAQLEVYQITWEAGDSTKQVIPLTEAQVQAILSEEGVVQPEWHLVCAGLQQNGADVASYQGTDYQPVPPTVLRILTEQCGYTFVTPEDFRGNMTAAVLEFYGGETYTADTASLPALQKMLTNARSGGGASACVFSARLTVTFDDGRTVSVLKGTDSCPSFTFGSWNSALVSQAENEQFWQIFGVPFNG